MTSPPIATDEPGHPRERILGNAAAILAARILSMAFRVFGSLKAAHHLGQEGWGLVGFLLSSIEVFKVLTNFGLDTAAIRFMALRERTEEETIRNLLAVKALLAGAGLSAALVTGLALPSYRGHLLLFLILALGLFPNSFVSTLTARFQANHRMERLIPVQFVTGLLYVIGVHVACWAGAGPGAFIGMSAGFEVLGFLLVAWTYRRSFRRVDLGDGWGSTLRLDGHLGLLLFRTGLPLGLIEVVVIIYSRLNVVFLERFSGLGSVGQFYAAMKVSEPLLAVAGAVAISAFPVLSRLAANGDVGRLRQIFVRYSLGSAALSCPVALVTTVFATDILGLIRAEFAAGAGALVALAWATAFMCQNQITSALINSFGKFYIVTLCACFNLVLFVILGLLLVPRYGATGAGLATLLMEGMNTVVQLTIAVFLLRSNRPPFRSTEAPPRPPGPGLRDSLCGPSMNPGQADPGYAGPECPAGSAGTRLEPWEWRAAGLAPFRPATDPLRPRPEAEPPAPVVPLTSIGPRAYLWDEGSGRLHEVRNP